MKRVNTMLHWANFNRQYEGKLARKLYKIFLDLQKNLFPTKDLADDIIVAVETRYKRNLEQFYEELRELTAEQVAGFITQHIVQQSPDAIRLAINHAIAQRGASLVTNLTDLEKDKLSLLMQYYGHERSYTEIAQVYRNYIGLTKPQMERLVALEKELLADGISVDKIAKILEKTSKQMLRYRSLVIARTEMAYSYTTAQNTHFAYYQDQTGREVTKIWQVSPDDLTCEICTNLHGERRNINEAFSMGVSGPPAHPNCRCYLTYEIKN